MVQHHTKYVELHGVDEVVEMSKSDHAKLHHRLRQEGKCSVPPDELAKISRAAHDRSDKRKAYQAEHKDKIDAYHKAYRAEHKDKKSVYNRKYHAEHPVDRSAYQRAYYIKHKDERNAYNNRYYEARKPVNE